MQLQVLQENLSKTLSQASRFISPKANLPILSNFLFIAEKTQLKIMATNLDMSISSAIGAKVEKEGRVTVPAKTILELVNNLTVGQINLNLDKEQLTIKSQDFDGKLSTIPANDFPTIPDNLDKLSAISLESKKFTSLLSKVLFSSSIDESRPVLTGVLFVFKAKKLSLVSSDGFRLSRKEIALDKEMEETSIIIPRTCLMEVLKIASSENNLLLEVRKKDNQVLIEIGNVCIATRLIDGAFPDFQKIIPVSPGVIVSVNKNDLLRAIKLASVFARESANVVKMKFEEGKINIESESGKVGKQTGVVEAKVDGLSSSGQENLTISFNYKFIEEFLNVVVGESIEIKLTDNSSPAIFIDPVDKDFLHLIMPVRVQG